MTRKKDFDRLIDSGDSVALLAAVKDPDRVSKLLRRIVSRLYSHDPSVKWRAVHALGIVVAPDGLSLDRIRQQVQRFVWAMSDESGAVPFGIAEAMGEILARRPELRSAYHPLLVSYIADDEMVQTGPILAGAFWALGRVGILDEEEKKRAIPGFEAALTSDDPEVQGAALWSAKNLGLAEVLKNEIEALTTTGGTVFLLIDDRIEELEIAHLARRPLDSGGV